MTVRDLLTGSACFVADLDLPGAAEAVIVRSYVSHGVVREINTHAARAVEGVLAVLTARDLPGMPTIPIRAFAQPGMDLRLQPVLAKERVRFVGEPVAVVVAEDQGVARDAAELVGLDIDPLPAVVDAADAEAEMLYDPPLDNVLCRYDASLGEDLGTAFARASIVQRAQFSTQRHTGAPMEPRGVLARWLDRDVLELWGPTKFLAFTRRTMANWFGLDPDRIRIHRVDVGGMFGVRGELYPEDYLIPWAASVVRRPVRWIEDRSEHLVSVNQGREVRYTFELALEADGSFLGFRCSAIVDMGAYTRPAGSRVPLLVVEELPGPYHWPAFEISCRGVATNKTPVGTLRAPSALESTFARERAIDMAAARLGMDPIEIRRRNLLPDGVAYTRRFGPEIHPQVYEPANYSRMLRDFLAAAAYAGGREQIDARRRAGEAAGLGAALFLAHSGLGQEEHVRVALGADGAFELHTMANEIGQGLESMLQRVAAAVLLVEPDEVRVRSGNTQDAPDGRGTFSSRSVIFAGNATLDACRHLVDQARTKASKQRNVPRELLRHVRNGFQHEDGLIRWEELAPLSADGMHASAVPLYGFGAALARVRLDIETHAVHVERLAVGYDSGRVVDRDGALGQLVGAAIQGFGATVLEESAYDRDGQPLSTTFMSYLLPSAADVPPVDAFFLSGPIPENPLGARGAGEAGINGVAAAIANAVAEAAADAGAGITALPLTPDILFRQRTGRGTRP